VFNWTIVDLPGMMKQPIGPLPENIEDLISSVIHDYIKNPRSILVAVQAANSPIVTSKSLKLAREIDPEGRRTLTVVTKLDLLDPSLDTYEVLTVACESFLKNEVIGVVNRSYQDVVNFKTMAAQIKDEAEFLREQYPMLSNKCGTPYLADTLNRLYLEQVRIAWPTIKSHINDQILVNLDDNEGTILEILAKFRITYCRSRKFKNAEIQKNSEESFSSTLDEIGPLTGLNRSHIQAAIISTAGKKDPLIMAFKFLVKKQIDLFTEPSLDCVKIVVEEMQEIAKNCTAELEGDIARFPKLRREIGQAMKE
jgi:dynamin 1-like protein